MRFFTSISSMVVLSLTALSLNAYGQSKSPCSGVVKNGEWTTSDGRSFGYIQNVRPYNKGNLQFQLVVDWTLENEHSETPISIDDLFTDGSNVYSLESGMEAGNRKLGDKTIKIGECKGNTVEDGGKVAYIWKAK